MDAEVTVMLGLHGHSWKFPKYEFIDLFGHLTTNGVRLEHTYQYVITHVLKINQQPKTYSKKKKILSDNVNSYFGE